MAKQPQAAEVATVTDDERRETAAAAKNPMKLVDGALVEMTDEEAAAWLASIPREDFFATLKVLRDAAIAGGTIIGGMPVYTDELSQQRITGAAVAAMLDPSIVINWKAADGSYVELNAEAVVGIATAMRLHVQACFDNEARLADALKATDKPDTVDLSEGWPVADAAQAVVGAEAAAK